MLRLTMCVLVCIVGTVGEKVHCDVRAQGQRVTRSVLCMWSETGDSPTNRQVDRGTCDE